VLGYSGAAGAALSLQAALAALAGSDGLVDVCRPPRFAEPQDWRTARIAAHMSSRLQKLA
jgi:hypothetical protein